MNKMMSGMVIQPTGDVDRDFVAMMAPHHQGAIEMAQAVLRNAATTSRSGGWRRRSS
jgi:uncharacterized protein (DUF305 family)